jgi:hypothetical protein
MLEACDKCGAPADVVHALTDADGKYDREKHGPLLCTKCWKEKEYFCKHCGERAPWGHNYCSSKCHFDAARADGYIEHLPNGLPPRCITARGFILEHEHGDHIDYKFPVDVEFIGEIDEEDKKEYKMLFDKEPTEEAVREYKGETHALIYTDGSIAVTMYERCYAMWYVRKGEFAGGSLWRQKEWKLDEQSLQKIIEYANGRKKND